MKNIFYAQSGGVTAVINATAAGVIQGARSLRVLAGVNGILGAIHEQLIDTSLEDISTITALMETPGGIFGSCRYKLPDYADSPEIYHRILQVLQAHNVGYFLYNGGGDSQDTTHKLATVCQQQQIPINCIGIPKTIDNDIPHIDSSPGFGSVAKYVATSIAQAGLDVKSMSCNSTKVFILEVMGRHTGWIAAASGLAQTTKELSPHIILMPEVPLQPAVLLKQVAQTVKEFDFCTIVVAEGVRYADETTFRNKEHTDAFGHAQLGGAGIQLGQMITKQLGYKHHCSVADYLQRSARHLASANDLAQAYTLGQHAVSLALSGANDVMASIKRTSNEPYTWTMDQVPLSEVANVEHPVPRNFISENGMHITPACRQYLLPLIQGESWPSFKSGLPVHAKLKRVILPTKLAKYNK